MGEILAFEVADDHGFSLRESIRCIKQHNSISHILHVDSRKRFQQYLLYTTDVNIDYGRQSYAYGNASRQGFLTFKDGILAQKSLTTV